MAALTEQELLVRAFDLVRGLLSEGSELDIKPYPVDQPDDGRDAAWEVTAPNYSSPLLVEAFRQFTPRDVDRVLGRTPSPLVRAVRRDPPVVVVAPWLSPRSRTLLDDRGINYVDLTGNIHLRIARPAVYLRLDGAQQDPNPPAKRSVRFKGSGINALVRVLVDVQPPYRMVELARVTGLSNAYVSRALEALHEERLIERASISRTVTDVDWQRLLHIRTDHYNLIKSNRASGYIARAGGSSLYRQLADQREAEAVVTGSFAAHEFVKLAAPSQLALYVPKPEDFAQSHQLLPAQEGANVLLLRAADQSQLDRTLQVAGAVHVGVSQLALDCLAGNGRLPEEGEALIEWMAANPTAWRMPKLPNTN